MLFGKPLIICLKINTLCLYCEEVYLTDEMFSVAEDEEDFSDDLCNKCAEDFGYINDDGTLIESDEYII